MKMLKIMDPLLIVVKLDAILFFISQIDATSIYIFSEQQLLQLLYIFL